MTIFHLFGKERPRIIRTLRPLGYGILLTSTFECYNFETSFESALLNLQNIGIKMLQRLRILSDFSYVLKFLQVIDNNFSTTVIGLSLSPHQAPAAAVSVHGGHSPRPPGVPQAPHCAVRPVPVSHL